MANGNAFHIPLSIQIITNIPKIAVIPYKISTDCFWVKPAFNILWCKWLASGWTIAFREWPFTNLLTIAKSVSNIGRARTIIGATITIAVYVLAIPIIEIIDKQYPKKFEPVSPIKVLAGLKLYGKNPTKAPAKAVIKIIDINGDSFNENIISNEIQEISVIPVERPSNPSIKFIALVTPTIQPIVKI